MNAPTTTARRRSPLLLVRYALPAALIIAGFTILLLAPGPTPWDS
jgi:hypothetical protein